MKPVTKFASPPSEAEECADFCRADHNSVFRFAPSPNGRLHLGHAYSAMVNFNMAKACGGKFLLRMEDIDVGRARPEFIDAIYEDLAWLGLTWESGVVQQSERFELYKSATSKLERLGVLYPCFTTRQELAVAANQDDARDEFGGPLYLRASRTLSADEVARRKAAGEPFALRLNMTRARQAAAEKLGNARLTYRAWDGEEGCEIVEANPGQWGDEAIVRKDTPASYHLAVVVDDAAQGISHVTRGQDLYSSTDLHRLLQVLLDLREPVYHHHKLIVDEKLRKLSKSDGDLSLAALRAAGVKANEICDHLEEFLASRNMSLFSWR